MPLQAYLGTSTSRAKVFSPFGLCGEFVIFGPSKSRHRRPVSGARRAKSHCSGEKVADVDKSCGCGVRSLRVHYLGQVFRILNETNAKLLR